MSDDRLTGILAEVAVEDIQIPAGISKDTANLMLMSEPSAEKAFPYVIAVVFLVNMLLSMLFAGILFLIRPISILEWVIIGSVYSTVNVFLYSVTFMNYEKVKDMLRAYSKGGI
ncbi:MAG: hypothetical protein R3232_01855 [Clostridia bacterium]|nr:hypothetical protein [Clostridia bacterium]